MFSKVWNKDGTINIAGLQNGIRAQNGLFHMRTATISPTSLDDYMGLWPLLVGFRHPQGFGHMNVLYGYNDSTSKVQAMEPWYPDTDSDGWDEGEPYLTDPNFTFTGAYVERPLGHYKTPPPGLGVLFVGYQEEYTRRMP
jgi:hypothetical protein